jgi:hypothetical protein
MDDISAQIDDEVALYVGYCRHASLHDEDEEIYKRMAHKVFYHIQELRSTGKLSILGKVTR